MKQALTAGGQISVWFESAKMALYKMGINFEEDLDLPGLKGMHPNYGRIAIEFFVPAPNKTKMEISVQDSALISEFKKIVIPAFKYFSSLADQQEEKADQTAEIPVQQPVKSMEKQPEKSAEQWNIAPLDAATSTAEKDELPKKEDAADQKDQIPPAVPTVSPKVKCCKYCQSELRDGDKVCPKCGKKQDNTLKIVGIIAGVVVLLGLIAFGFYSIIGKKNTDTVQSTSNTQNGSSETNTESTTNQESQTQLVTYDQFQQVQTGMTYEQICGIMGREGTFLEPETQVTNANGDVVTLKTYYWSAEGSQGANVCVTFQNGAAATISQYGLK